MFKKVVLGIIVASLISFISACTFSKPAARPASSSPIELNVSAAMGLKNVLLDIQKAYESSHPNIKIVYNLAASGVLQTQIEQGSTTDIFISAAPKQIDELSKKDLIEPGSYKNLAANKLVLIVPKDSKLKIDNFKDLTQSTITHYGLGDPATVPAGQYGIEVLKNLGIWNDVQDKAILAKDVKTILSYVETGNAEAGIVFSTVAITSDKIKIVTDAPKDSHQPIIFPRAILKTSKNKEAAQEFLDYLDSPAGAKVLQQYGFQPVR